MKEYESKEILPDGISYEILKKVNESRGSFSISFPLAALARIKQALKKEGSGIENSGFRIRLEESQLKVILTKD